MLLLISSKLQPVISIIYIESFVIIYNYGIAHTERPIIAVEWKRLLIICCKFHFSFE